MKAIRIHKHGGPEQLIYEDAPNPTPARGEALVRVVAAAVTPTELSWASAYATRDRINRLPSIPGHELSGVVEAIGPEAAGLSVADDWSCTRGAGTGGTRGAGRASRPPRIDTRPGYLSEGIS